MEDLGHIQDRSPEPHTELDGPARSPEQARVLLLSSHPLLAQVQPINISICPLPDAPHVGCALKVPPHLTT